MLTNAQYVLHICMTLPCCVAYMYNNVEFTVNTFHPRSVSRNAKYCNPFLSGCNYLQESAHSHFFEMYKCGRDLISLKNSNEVCIEKV